jgi:recombination DNA repair RAD52 pathway protein
LLNNQQYEQLLKPLNPKRVAKREQAGRTLSYLEAWDVKAHLIRVFGFGGWSWEVTEATLAYEDKNERGQWEVGYKVVGTLTIHDLGCRYTEAAVGSASLPRRGEAHDMAIKTAESDGLKRAAINLGTQFGLSLYNDGSLNDVVIQTLDRKQQNETPDAS